MSLKNNQEILLVLIKTGLWETEGQFSSTEGVDWDEVYRLASEQSVLGVVLAGIEHLIVKPPQELLLQMIGEVQMIEQTNKAMNQFIEKLVGGMRKADIYTLLVKGQGIAQCYERPLWRQSGDVDLLLSEDNYQKAKHYLLPLCTDQKNEERYSQHLGLNIDQWYVEIHGSLRTGLSGRVDKEVDANQRNVFYDGQIRSWNNGNTQVFLPASDNDVFFVFTHFIKHFYKEGMGLRQVCDWCRLMWTYKDTLNHELLEKRIKRAGLMSEWKAFAALAIEYLGMPVEAMPLYDVTGKKDEVRGKKLIAFILAGYSGNKMKDTMQIAKIFPWKTLRYSPSIFLNVNWLKVRERLFN